MTSKSSAGALPPSEDTAEPKARAPTEKQKAARALLPVLAAMVAAAALLFAIRLMRRPPELLVAAAHVEDVTRVLAVTGRIEAERTVLVTPQFVGRLTEIVRHEGDRVKAGEVIARIADTAAKSEVRQAQANLSARQKDLEQGRRDLARTKQLVASGASATAELEAAQLVVSRASDDVLRLTSVLHEGESQLVLLAPFDGTIVRRDGEIGQVVGPSSAVFEIATVASSRVTAQVDERYVRALLPGMHAQVLPLDAEGAAEEATVSYVAQAVDPLTGAATVRFAYQRPPNGVLVGMSVDVNVSVATVLAAVTIPRESVGGSGAHAFVLVVSGESVQRREIAVDDWPAPLVIVHSGIKGGELVALDPKAAALGARVRARIIPDGV
ncbi:MAG: efflux RND transporter periplasmic adaptor subunit [Polyangiaceae bacterium]